MALVCYLYATAIILLAVFLAFVDKIFPLKEFFLTLLKILIVVVCRFLFLYYQEITTRGIKLYF